MFCGNCGTNNQDGTAFCANCGAPLVSNQQPQSASAQFSLPEFFKKNMKAIIIGAAALVALILLIALLSGGHGYSSPEDAAEAWIEGKYDCDVGDMLSAVYPEMADAIEKDLEKYIEKLEKEVDLVDADFSDFEAEENEEYDVWSEKELGLYEDWFNKEYGTNVKFTAVKRMKVSYEFETRYNSGKDTDSVTVVEIDGDWYVWPSSYIDVELDYGEYDYDYDGEYDYGY